MMVWLFWICVFLLIYSYLIYPFILSFLAKYKKLEPIPKSSNTIPVAILIAVFNEEKVIKSKIESILKNIGPNIKVDIFIGSDQSSDRTHQIIESFIPHNKNIFLKIMDDRMGKPNVINSLIDHYKILEQYSVVILTDANIMFSSETIPALIHPFSDKEIGMVCGNILNNIPVESSVGAQEEFYISHELLTKYNEGLLFGTAMGAFGACFSMRADLIKPIPTNFIVDDFFLSALVLKAGKKIIVSKEAICYEDIPGDINEEFRRKKRIAAGNFQNLFYFPGLLGSYGIACGFCFISHKLIRWIGPILLLIMLICSLFLFQQHELFKWIFFGIIFLGGMLLMDGILAKRNVNFRPLRLVRYFVLMNVAVLLGMIRFFGGIKSNIWKPTNRI